jgi:hypothetical protein
MGKVRRGNFVFVFWEGDPPPRHVHVYRDDDLIVKWDLEIEKAMRGLLHGKFSDTWINYEMKEDYEDQKSCG